MSDMVHTAEVRPLPGSSGGFELLLNGRVFPHYLSREPVEVTHLISGDAPLYKIRLEVYAERVAGFTEFNEFMAEEADAARVRQADRHDARLEHWRTLPDNATHLVGQLVPESEFQKLWEM